MKVCRNQHVKMLLKLLREIRTADIISYMKSTIKKRTWKSIYRLLDRVSPIDGDCGRLCGSVCCTCGSKDNTKGEDELGIYLYPGEHKIHNKKIVGLSGPQNQRKTMTFPRAGPVPFTLLNAKHLLFALETKGLCNAGHIPLHRL